jgi:type IV pilus assembly protein PilA
MLQKLRRTNQKGFTLIELMIVIAIIGILSAIAIPNFLSYRRKGQDSAARSTAQNFLSLSMGYWSDLGPSTFNAANNSTGLKYTKDSKITAAGTIGMNTEGTAAGTATFIHQNSSNTYTLTASDGKVVGP